MHEFEDIRIKGFEDKTLIDAFNDIVVGQNMVKKIKDHKHGVQDIGMFYCLLECM